jgi:hypothetical protein
MLKDATGLSKTEAGIEDIFPDDFYRELVNEAYGLSIKDDELPDDGLSMISTRLDKYLKIRHSGMALDKRRVLSAMLKRFDGWKKKEDLPTGTAERAANLFAQINRTFATPPDEPRS